MDKEREYRDRVRRDRNITGKQEASTKHKWNQTTTMTLSQGFWVERFVSSIYQPSGRNESKKQFLMQCCYQSIHSLRVFARQNKNFCCCFSPFHVHTDLTKTNQELFSEELLKYMLDQGKSPLSRIQLYIVRSQIYTLLS